MHSTPDPCAPGSTQIKNKEYIVGILLFNRINLQHTDNMLSGEDFGAGKEERAKV